MQSATIIPFPQPKPVPKIMEHGRTLHDLTEEEIDLLVAGARWRRPRPSAQQHEGKRK